jgi:hypothetical protein
MKVRSAWVVFFLAVAVACAKPTPIAEIEKNPGAFRDRVITVQGTVRAATKLPFINQGFYSLDDGTGSLPVLSEGDLPAEGKSVKVRGRIRSAFEVGGKSFGVILVPEER